MSFDPCEWMSFYHQGLSRDEAVRMLSSPQHSIGSFLLRDSSKPGGFSLSVKESDTAPHVRHYLIERVDTDQGREAVQIAGQRFSDIPALLNHYRIRLLDRASLTVPLRKASIQTVLAKHAFQGERASDLPFVAGERLHIRSKPESEWWEAVNALGQTGLVPATYLCDEAFAPPSAAQKTSDQSSSDVSSGGDQTAESTARKRQIKRDNLPSFPARAVLTANRAPNLYDPMLPRLRKGDEVFVQRLCPSGFAEAQLSDGKLARVPHSILQYIIE